MKIFEAKQAITKATTLLNSLKTDSCFDSQDTQTQLTALLASFTPDVIHGLKLKLNKRSRKRQREARNRIRVKNAKEELQEITRKRNEEIDRLFKQEQEETERKNAEASVRRQADVVLHTVTRHKVEGRRVLSLLTALSKLRAGRCQQDVASGGTELKIATEVFETALGKLRGLWEKQMGGYGMEEAGLKVMLAEGSASCFGQAERELDSILHDWLLAIFGEESFGELPWQQIVEARRQWDQYIVSPDMALSSGIPPGWVLPQVLNDEWSQYVSYY